MVHVVPIEGGIAVAQVTGLGGHPKAGLPFGSLIVVILGGQAGILIGIGVETGRCRCGFVQGLLGTQKESLFGESIGGQAAAHCEQQANGDHDGQGGG